MFSWFKKRPNDKNDSQASWPFDQGPNVAALNLKSIASKQQPILHVVHDSDDHGWQFLTLDDADPAEAAVVSMKQIVEMDPTVLGVADIPPGWHAWRKSEQDTWQRSPQEGG